MFRLYGTVNNLLKVDIDNMNVSCDFSFKTKRNYDKNY